MLLRAPLVLGVVPVLLGGGREPSDRSAPNGSATAAPRDGSDCKHSRSVVRVRLSRRRYPHVTDRLQDVRGRYPRVWHIDS